MIKKLSILAVICLGIALSASAAKKPTIIPEVNAKKQHIKKKAKATAMQTTSLSQAELNDAPPVDVTTTLSQEQSIVRPTNTSGDNSQTALSIRGFGDNASANSLILIDGFPLTNATSLAPNINALTLEDIANIEIYQGSQGTLWGDQAVGGVVNITTRTPKKFIGNASGQYGSFNQQYVSALLGSKLQNNTTFKGFVFLDRTNGYRKHNFHRLNSGLAQLGYQYNSGSITFYLRDYATTTFLPGGLTRTQFVSDPRQATNFQNYARYDTTLMQLLSKQVLNDEWLLETRLFNQNMNGKGRVAIDFKRNEWQVYFNPRVIGRVYKNKIIAGYMGELSHFHMNNRMVDDTVNEKEQNLYAELTIPFREKWQVIIGGRQAWQDNTIQKGSTATRHANDQLFVSEQGLTYNANSEWQLYLRRDGNFRFPKANEQTWLHLGVSSLQPQDGVSYETGATWKTESNRLQLSLYRLQLHNEIAFNPTQTPTEPFGAFQNYQRTNRDGATITDTFKIKPNTTLNAQLNYIDARFESGTFKNKEIPAVPSVNGNVGIAYNWTDNWQVKYYGIYTGRRYASEDNANQNGKLAAYWLNNIALQYKFMGVIASVEVNNLLDKNYSGYTLYDADTRQNTFYPGIGRSYMLTVKANVN